MHAAVLSKTKRNFAKEADASREFLEDRSPSGKVDMSCSRVAALHYVEDCIDGHIRDTVRVDRNAGVVL